MDVDRATAPAGRGGRATQGGARSGPLNAGGGYSARFHPLLEGLVEITEAGARVGQGPAGEGRQQPTETLALDQQGATVAGGQREAVLAADDPREAGGPPQFDARLGDDDLGLDGHQAAMGRVNAAQRDRVA